MRLGGLRCATAAAAFAIVASAPGRAQQPPDTPPDAPPPQPPVFRSEASLVRVDAIVVDRHGDPVATLTADDFAVEEDGAPQTVQSFKFVSADGRPLPGDEDSLAIRSPEHAAAEAARDDVRVFLIFWDEYHIGRFGEAIRGRKALTDFVTSAFGPTDLVALMDPLLPVSALRFTRDRTDLAASIRTLEGRYGVYIPTRSAVEDAQLQTRDAARLRSEVTLSAMKSAAVHLGGLKEGRKAIVFVSQGLSGLWIDEPRLVQDLTDTANHNNVALYTVDPRGLGSGRADVLRTLAENTGGQAFVNTNAPEAVMRNVIKDASAFYLLGYSSTRNPSDGRFHKITVRVKRPGFDVRARKGYWAPSLADRERARTEAAAAEALPADVSIALAALAPARAERLVDVWVGTARGTGGQAAVTVAWTPRPGRTAGAERTVSIAAKGAGGDRVFDTPLDAGRVSFEAPPGPLPLHLSVRDAAGNTLDEDRRALVVPDFSGGRLSLSSPVLLRARNIAEVRALADAIDVTPFAGHEFVRTDRVFIRFTVYGDSASQAVASARLLTRTGDPLAALPIAPLIGSDPSYQVDFPLSSTARGDYLIAVEVAHDDDRARMVLPLRVVP